MTLGLQSALPVALVICTVAGGCASTVHLPSSRLDQPVTIDAQLSEWGGKLEGMSRNAFMAGIQNDDEYLYVSLSSRDPRTIGSIMRNGLIVWIDPTGEQNETLGVRFPLGFASEEARDPNLGEGPAANRVRMERSTSQVAIIGADGQTVLRAKDSVPGLSVAIEADQGVLTYEMQIPLAPAEGVLYAIGVEPGQDIGVGFVTPDAQGMNVAQLPGSGGLPGGRMPSAEGRRHGGPYFGGGLAVDSIEEWAITTLIR